MKFKLEKRITEYALPKFPNKEDCCCEEVYLALKNGFLFASLIDNELKTQIKRIKCF